MLAVYWLMMNHHTIHLHVNVTAEMMCLVNSFKGPSVLQQKLCVVITYLYMGVIKDLVGDFTGDERVGLFIDLHVCRRRPFPFIRLLHDGCKQQKWSRLHPLEPFWGQIRRVCFKQTAVFMPQCSVQRRLRPQHHSPSAVSLLRDFYKSPYSLTQRTTSVLVMAPN